MQIDLRIVSSDGTTPVNTGSGLVQAAAKGSAIWFSVCAADITATEATTICRYLGFQSYSSVTHVAQPSANYLVSSIDCGEFYYTNINRCEVYTGLTCPDTSGSLSIVCSNAAPASSLIDGSGNSQGSNGAVDDDFALVSPSPGWNGNADSGSSDSSGVAIGAGVGIPLGLLLIGGVGYLLYRHQQKMKKEAKKEAKKHHNEQEMQKVNPMATNVRAIGV